MSNSDQNKKRKNGNALSILIILLTMLLCIGVFSVLQFTELGVAEPVTSESALPAETMQPDASVIPTADLQEPASEPAQTPEGTDTASMLPVYPVSEARVTYQDGFYYEPVEGNAALIERIRTLSYNEAVNTRMPYSSLSYIRVKYINFQDQEAEGELICASSIAQDVVEIFYELYQARYQIESIRLVDDFNADDNASMEANNTSAFNYRLVAGYDNEISEHSWGICIDLNPLYNPYVAVLADGTTVVQPASGAQYADRSADFPHKIDENDLAYQVFTAHGFTWGGHWASVKDYQHFQKNTD